MNTRQPRQIRTETGRALTPIMCALTLAMLGVGCSSRSSYSRSYSSSSSASYGNTSGSSNNNSSNYNFDSNSGGSSKSSASSTTVDNIDAPLRGSGDLSSDQLRAVNHIIVTAGGTKVTAEELEYINEKLAEADDRPSARDVAIAVVQYRYAEAQEARQRQLQQRPQQQAAPYGGAQSPGYGGPPTPYRGLSDSEKQAIWSQQLPKYTQEERKRAVDPYGSNSNR